jgi:class 3 adenylate cyclase
LTVAFCDLVGSTALSVQLDPEDLRDVIALFHRCVSETVSRYDGSAAILPLLLLGICLRRALRDEDRCRADHRTRPHKSDARQRLESIGFKVILKAMDWSTNLVVRARKEPPDKGGWNLLHTFWQAADVINPAVHFGVSGAGPRAWFGWPNVPQLEKLVTDWVRATDQTKRNQLAGEVQKAALSEVTYVPWGEWVKPTAFRRNARDVLKFGAPIFGNAKLT